MSGTAFKCTQCDGQGQLLIDVSADGNGRSFVEKPCPTCEGAGNIPSPEFAALTYLGRIEARQREVEPDRRDDHCTPDRTKSISCSTSASSGGVPRRTWCSRVAKTVR